MDVNEYLKMKRGMEDFVKKNGKTVMNQFIQDFFDANPEVQALMWSQSTPEWNDGSPCIFHVNELFCSTVVPSEEDWNDGYEGECWNSDWSKSTGKALEKFESQLGGELESLSEHAFGESKVMVSRQPDGKIKVETESVW